MRSESPCLSSYLQLDGGSYACDLILHPRTPRNRQPLTPQHQGGKEDSQKWNKFIVIIYSFMPEFSSNKQNVVGTILSSK